MTPHSSSKSSSSSSQKLTDDPHVTYHRSVVATEPIDLQ